MLTCPLPRPLTRFAMALAAIAAVTCAQAAGQRSSLYSLLPTNVSESSLTRPGESREHRFSGESLLPLVRGLQWQTSTDLKRTRYEQLFPAQAQTLNLSTGPRLKLGPVEFAMPFNAMREVNGVGATDAWRSTAPRLTLALGPNDHIRLEARVSRDGSTYRSRRWTSLSWRHSINERWALSTGVSHSLSSTADGSSSSAEAHAGVDWSKPRGLSWSLTSRLSGSAYEARHSEEAPTRGHVNSLSLSTRYPMRGGWWLGSELRTSHSFQSGTTQPVVSQSAGIRLFRNF